MVIFKVNETSEMSRDYKTFKTMKLHREKERNCLFKVPARTDFQFNSLHNPTLTKCDPLQSRTLPIQTVFLWTLHST